MPVPNYNYDTEQADLQRRQKIADAMMGGALQPLQMPQGGRIVAKVNPLQAMLPALQAFMARRDSDGIKADQGKLSERYQADLRTGMDAFGETAKTDKRKAIQDAMASNHPVLKEYGLSELKKLQDNALKPSDLVGISDPTSVLSNQGDTSQWKPKKAIKDVGGVLYDENTLETQQLNGPAPERKEYKGDLYEQNPTTGQWKKLDNAPKVSVHTSMNPVIAGHKAGMQEYFKNAAGQVDKLGQTAAQASNNMQTIAELERLDANGIFSNNTAPAAMALANFAESAGIPVDKSKLGNSEAYVALTTDLWQGLVTKYGGNRGVTKEEALEIKKMLPLVTSSPEARRTISTILKRGAERQITQYKNANQSFATAVQKDDPSLFSVDFESLYNPEPTKPEAVTPPAARPQRPGNARSRSVSNW